MPNISSYPLGTPEGSDILIGTDVSNGQTKNYSVTSLTNFTVDEYLNQVAWQFIVTDPSPEPIPASAMYFDGFGGNSTPWSSVTTIRVNTIMSNSTNSLPYLQYLVTPDPTDPKHTNQPHTITISDKHNLGSFGVFEFTDLTQVGATSQYDLSLSYKEGSNGLQALQIYGISLDPIDSQDKTFIYTQTVPSTSWVIQHDLDKFPSVSVVDTQNTYVTGSVTYDSANQITITFSAGFGGKAYLN